MPENSSQYRESLIQWIWQELQFDCSSLTTRCGKSLRILDPGKLNHGAGPDFLSARLVIDGLEWHGSVEIHHKAADWYAHGHHKDKEFNSVVLHVAWEGDHHQEAVTCEGHTPFSLTLEPYVGRELYDLLRAKNRKAIACGANVQFLNQKAFEFQIEKAHREYFDYKVNELLSGYPAGEPISKAWKQCLVRQVYATLGISANKEQMIELAGRAILLNPEENDLKSFINAVNHCAFTSGEEPIHWVTGGVRPSSLPRKRIKQAANIHYAICRLPFKHFIEDISDSWSAIYKMISSEDIPGAFMKNLVFSTAYVPAVYLLGKLLYSRKLMDSAYHIWMYRSPKAPSSISDKFQKAGFSIPKDSNKLGLAHQYKRYCIGKNCKGCKVFKKAIRS